MKKIFAIATITLFMASCNSGSSSGSGTSDSTADKKMSGDSSMNSMTMAPTEGTMMMKSGKMMVMKNNQWENMDQPMTCTDSCKVSPDGQIVMKNGEKMMLKEGESIDKDGMMMDSTGKMMDMKMDDKMMGDSSKKM